MAENDRPNDGGDYSSLEWREVWVRFLNNGVIPGVDNELECTGDGATMNIAVDTGEAMVNGCWYENTAAQNQAQTSDADDPRINRIVLRWTSADDSVICDTVEGTPAGSPSPPALTRDANTWELSLCQVYVAALAATLTTANITVEVEWAHPQGEAMPQKLTNQSGGTLDLGDVVIQDTGNDEAVDTTTTANDGLVRGVIGEYEIADTVAGDVVCAGLAWVYLDAAATRGQYIVTSTTAKQASPVTAMELGAFGYVLKTTSGAGLALCWLFGMPNVGKYSVGCFVWFAGGTVATGSNYTGMKYVMDGNEIFTGWDVVASTGPAGADLIVDIHKAGTTLFTTQANRPKILDGQTKGTNGAPDVTSGSDNQLLLVDVDQVGSGTAGADVTVQLWYKKPLV